MNVLPRRSQKWPSGYITALGISLLLSSCGNGNTESSQLNSATAQCWQIVQHYLKLADDNNQKTTIAEDKPNNRVSIALSFNTRSALGDNAAKASCEYSLAADTTEPMPSKLVIGNTVFDQSKDIAELVALKNHWETPAHDH